MDSMNPSEVAIQTGWAPKLVAAAELEALIEDCYPRIRRAALVLTGRESGRGRSRAGDHPPGTAFR